MTDRNKEKIIDPKVIDMEDIKEVDDEAKNAEKIIEIQVSDVPEQIVLKRGNQEIDTITYVKKTDFSWWKMNLILFSIIIMLPTIHELVN